MSLPGRLLLAHEEASAARGNEMERPQIGENAPRQANAAPGVFGLDE